MTFIHVVGLVLAYWAAALIVARAVYRRGARPVQPETYEQISDTEYVVTFTDTIKVGRFAVLAFGPPLALVIVWLLF